MCKQEMNFIQRIFLEHNDVYFRRADVLIEDLDDSRGCLGDQYRITKFSGTIYEFDFNKQFVCTITDYGTDFKAWRKLFEYVYELCKSKTDDCHEY